MVIADTLSRYSPEDTPEILLDSSVNHVYIDAEKKRDYQLAIKDDPLLSALADTIILDGQTISRMFQKHYDHTMDNVICSL